MNIHGPIEDWYSYPRGWSLDVVRYGNGWYNAATGNPVVMPYTLAAVFQERRFSGLDGTIVRCYRKSNTVYWMRWEAEILGTHT